MDEIVQTTQAPSVATVEPAVPIITSVVPPIPQEDIPISMRDEARKYSIDITNKNRNDIRKAIKDVKQEKESKAMAEEIESKLHIFEISSKKERFAFKWPSVKQNRIADWKQSETFNEAVTAGLPLEDEMLRILRNKKLWTEEDDKKLDELRTKYIMVNARYNVENDPAEELKKERKDARQTLLDFQSKRQKYIGHTAEAKAEEIRTAYLVSQITVYAESSKPVWTSYEEFDNEVNRAYLYEIIFEYITWGSGVSKDFFSEE